MRNGSGAGSFTPASGGSAAQLMEEEEGSNYALFPTATSQSIWLFHQVNLVTLELNFWDLEGKSRDWKPFCGSHKVCVVVPIHDRKLTN